MEAYSWVPALLGGLGLGSLITTVIGMILNQSQERARYLRDKKEQAYIGLLRAYSDAMEHSDEKRRLEFVHWHFQVQLFGGKAVDAIIREFYEQTEYKPGSQIEVRQRLIAAMRQDLGVPA